jgi:hypothetical protein
MEAPSFTTPGFTVTIQLDGGLFELNANEMHLMFPFVFNL